ncbi:hypothetical protein [Bartonella sp. ML70XJBT]|uniref:hypothetical protein n=1 Tax=Bartonella sp. ML70XJBT TaxID=3019096 RepID=UPI002360E39E|nr:hypothetical protein [Bartonella sp. ML70XJBT]
MILVFLKNIAYPLSVLGKEGGLFWGKERGGLEEDMGRAGVLRIRVLVKRACFFKCGRHGELLGGCAWCVCGLGDGLDCCAVGGSAPWILPLEKRGVLLHGKFSLNGLMSE